MLKNNNVNVNTFLSIFQNNYNNTYKKNMSVNNLLIIWSQLKNDSKVIDNKKKFYNFKYNWFLNLSFDFLKLNSKSDYLSNDFKLKIIEKMLLSFVKTFFKKTWSWIKINKKDVCKLKSKKKLNKAKCVNSEKKKLLLKIWINKSKFNICFKKSSHILMKRIKKWSKNIKQFLSYNVFTKSLNEHLFNNFFFIEKIINQARQSKQKKSQVEAGWQSFFIHIYLTQFHFLLISLSKLKIVKRCYVQNKFYNYVKKSFGCIFYAKYDNNIILGTSCNKPIISKIQNLIFIFMKLLFIFAFKKKGIVSKKVKVCHYLITKVKFNKKIKILSFKYNKIFKLSSVFLKKLQKLKNETFYILKKNCKKNILTFANKKLKIIFKTIVLLFYKKIIWDGKVIFSMFYIIKNFIKKVNKMLNVKSRYYWKEKASFKLLLKNETNTLLNEYHSFTNKSNYLKLSFLNVIILDSSLNLQKYLNNLKASTYSSVLSSNKIIKVYYYMMYRFLLDYRIVYNFDKLKSIGYIISNSCASILKSKYSKSKLWIYKNIFIKSKWHNVFTKNYIFKLNQKCVNRNFFFNFLKSA